MVIVDWDGRPIARYRLDEKIFFFFIIVLCNKRPLSWSTSEMVKRDPGAAPSHSSGPCQTLDSGNASGRSPPGRSHRPPVWLPVPARSRASHAPGGVLVFPNIDLQADFAIHLADLEP